MAGRLSDAWLDELRSRANLEEIVSEYVPLKQKGRRFWGCCPFHNEKTPSFSVDSEAQMYYCFGCHKGGTVINFVMEMERMEFMDAVRLLADRAHMEIPEQSQTGSGRTSPDERERIYEANTLAARFFHSTLWTGEGAEALNYLYKRGLNDSDIRRFGLGAAPKGWDALQRHMAEQGFDDALLEKAGLVDAALRCGVKPFSTLTALLCKAVRAYLDKDEVLYSYSTDARDALGAPNALYNCVASFQRKLPLTADAPLAEVAVGVDADLKENLSAERKLFRIAEQMGWVYRVYQQKASLSIKKRIFQMGEYISGFPADFWVSYLGDPFAPSSPELTRYIEDFQTWVPADGASIGLECTSLHGIITLCVKNKVPRPGFAEALRAAFEAEGIKVLEAAELGADNT